MSLSLLAPTEARERIERDARRLAREVELSPGSKDVERIDEDLDEGPDEALLPCQLRGLVQALQDIALRRELHDVGVRPCLEECGNAFPVLFRLSVVFRERAERAGALEPRIELD